MRVSQAGALNMSHSAGGAGITPALTFGVVRDNSVEYGRDAAALPFQIDSSIVRRLRSDGATLFECKF
jgi:hypothetical protein